MSSSQPQLDHIVILLPHSTLATLHSHLKDVFTVAPGGTHANGVTANKLVLFQDGVYIELIAFLSSASPEDRAKHPWGALPENTIVDFAFTLPEESAFSEVQKNVREANAGIRYGDPQAGGRTREDGVVLKWATSHPYFEDGEYLRPGSLPFWCLDRTTRELRVPYEGSELTDHASAVTGVSSVSVTAPEGKAKGVSRVFSAVLHAVKSDEIANTWAFKVPSGKTFGKQILALKEGDSLIELTLVGNAQSPRTVEIAPGLVVHIEADD